MSHAHPRSLRHALHLAEQEIEAHLARIFKEREERELAREPSLAQIPRILLRKPPTQAQSSLPQQELGRQARARLREKMSNLVLQHMELEQMWGLLKRHASPPHQPTDERINWDDFSQIAEAMPQRAAESYFSAKHFVLFDLDAYGRIPIVHFFQWAMRKNELMRTRAELELYDSGGDGWLTENDLQQYVEDLLPRLPALTGLLEAFVHFYKVTAVRKFFFFLDARRRGRIAIKEVLCSPILQELALTLAPALALTLTLTLSRCCARPSCRSCSTCAGPTSLPTTCAATGSRRRARRRCTTTTLRWMRTRTACSAPNPNPNPNPKP